MLVLITTADRNFDAGALETLIARRQFRLEPFYVPPKRPSVMILLPLISLNSRPSTTNTTLGGLDCLLTNMIHTPPRPLCLSPLPVSQRPRGQAA